MARWAAAVRVIANGVRRLLSSRPADVDKDRLHTIFVGRLVANKRVSLLLQALSRGPQRCAGKSWEMDPSVVASRTEPMSWS
jgi:hypothetical protein